MPKNYEVNNATKLLGRERLEDNLVHAVQELWAESTLELGHNTVGNLFIGKTLEPSDEKPMAGWNLAKGQC